MHVFYFEQPDEFPEIVEFVRRCDAEFGLGLATYTGSFKARLQELVEGTPVRAVVLGTRRGDPNAGGQETFCPSSEGWPPFMRVNPILDWEVSPARVRAPRRGRRGRRGD